METGLHYMMQEQTKTNKDVLKTYDKELSIQVKLSGLSFCIFNPVLNCIENICSINWEEEISQKEVIEKITDFLETKEVLHKKFHTVRVMYSDEYFTFIPETLFDETISAEYLKYNTRIPASGKVIHERIEPLSLIVAHIIPSDIDELLKKYFQVNGQVHSSSFLLRTLVPHKASHGKNIVYLYLEKDFFYLVIFQENQLVFFNRFEYLTKEDLLYYTLFSLEQIKVDTMETPLFLLGGINRNNPIYKEILKYFKNIYFFKSMHEYAFCQNMDDDLAQNHFLLTHLF